MRSLWQGAVAGAAGVAVMTLGEKVEQPGQQHAAKVPGRHSDVAPLPARPD